ncbi:MAG: L,D-transpeptidase family protein [Hyphomicrobiaceae bacterium]|jgi:murein L,D-transpeptidase YcbB/YkuD
MVARMIGGITRVGRASVLLGALLAAAPVAGAGAQEAQWWESIPGFGKQGSSYRTASEERRKPEVMNDLRADSTPFRSEAMIGALEGAIARYQDIIANGGWPAIPGNRMMRPEDDDERVPLLRKRLAMSGELARAKGNSFSFNDDLEEAVRRYQENNGLRVTGRVDKPTLAALNVPAQARLQQLRANLQRLRDLMAQKIEDRYVLVNVPAFQLEAVERHQVELRHRVIAGKPERETPSVRAQIRALNFFPYWRVPDSVAKLDLIPRLQKEPDYLQKEQIRVMTGSFNGPLIDSASVDWRQADVAKIKFRQDPGPQNALGLVRLDMPNEHGVYMHDTPMKPLFGQRGRAFSAGCVRVQDVFTLAEWVARYEPGWNEPGRAQQIVDAGQPVDVVLSRPVPVYFAYITAWAEPADGRVVFRPDVYSRDGLRDLIAGHDRDPSEGPAPSQTLAP